MFRRPQGPPAPLLPRNPIASPQRRMLVLAVAIAAIAALGGCLDRPGAQCADGTWCAEGMVCDEARGACVRSEQVDDCAGQPDQTACRYPGVDDGLCYAGVCLPGGCGNGIVDPNEACDDGDNIDGDGCSSDCESDETCGNGIIDLAAQESCDPGDDSDWSGCRPDCVSKLCGDGVLDEDAFEECDCGDDADNLPAGCAGINSDLADAGCRSSCRDQSCGDGIVDLGLGEECDDGNLFPGDGCSGGCAVERCGNGVIDLELVGMSYLPAEACDDGENGLNHDGCAAACTLEEPMWSLLQPASPSPRAGHAMAYDAARGKILLFGGSDADGRDGETWQFDGQTATWTLLTTAGETPSPRSDHAMAYDAARGKVLLFGGARDGHRNSETWEFDGKAATWTQLATVGDAPSPRSAHAMAYDAARRKVLLFGGTGNRGRNGETWEFDGQAATWTRLATVGDAPSTRRNHAMAYDTARGTILLFGGFNDDYDGAPGAGDNNGETWEFDGQAATWTRLATVGDAPSPRRLHAMAYDAARRKVLLFGGHDDAGYNGETWEFDGHAATWTRLSPADDAPSPRRYHAMAYDAARGEVLLFGGEPVAGSYDGETWQFDGTAATWTRLATVGDAPSPRSDHAMAYDAARRKVLLFGGTGNHGLSGETWEFDGRAATWTRLATVGGAPSTRNGHAMAYDAARGKVLLFGGWTEGGVDSETWEFDGQAATWTRITTVGDTPSPRGTHAMAYDAARGKAVLFGGSGDDGSNGETWEFDGQAATWTRITTVGDTPSPRMYHTVAYDAARAKVLLFGGWTEGGVDSETWEFDGQAAAWTRIMQVGDVPSPRWAHAMAYDAARGKVLLFGGYHAGLEDGETWEFDGQAATWTLLSTVGDAPSPRGRHAMAYDAARGTVLLFGGYDNTSNTRNSETWTFQHTFGGGQERCSLGFDGDGDGLIGCDDPDCWSSCTPLCPPRSTPSWPTDCDSSAPHCGDGVCNPDLESPRMCPGDCGLPTPICGDFHCDAAELAATCPGDCSP